MPTPRTPLRPPPGQTSLAARLAAPDQADQVGGTRHFGGGLFDFIFVLFILSAMVAVLVYCTAGLWGVAA